MSERVHPALGRARSRVRAQWRALVHSVERRGEPRGEDGFMLLESIVAISLIVVLLAALGGFTITTTKAVDQLRARQAAAQIATSGVAKMQALPATDLVTGRGKAAVTAQRDRATSLVKRWLVISTSPTVVYNADYSWADDSLGATSTAGANANVSTDPQTQTLNNVPYRVETYLGVCVMATPSSTSCGLTGTGLQYVRAVVAVTWGGNGCSTTTCAYVTSTLVSTASDPVFNTNRATPPVKPIVESPGNQTNTVGAVVNLQLGVADNTGVPPFTWQLASGTLPTGLTLSASGLFTGSPTTPVNAAPLRVTVIDAFGRSGSETFTWTVVAAPTITKPANQTSQQGAAVSVPVASTCPNTPCKYTLANAPAGLSINANTGVITGTPTTPGTSANVTVTVTDADNVSATTAPFTWTVNAGGTIGSPGTRGMTIGQAESVAIPYTCPSVPCTITLANAVPGVGLSTTANNTTNNIVTTLSVSAASGTVYLAGTVQTTAVTTGTSRAYAPTVTLTKNATTVSSAGAWTAYTRPTIGAVGTRNATVNTTKNIPVAYTCSFAPCTLTLANTVPGLGLSTTSGITTTNNTTSLVVSGSGTVYINGRVGAGAVPTGTSKAYALALTITDADAAAASSTGTWTASNAPKLTNPGSQAAEPNQTINLQLSADCPNGGCTWLAEAQYGGFWTQIPISSTGRISYANAPAGAYTVRITVTDADGITDQVTFPLTVTNFALTMPSATTAVTTSRGGTTTFDVAPRVSPAVDGYTYSLVNNPAWLTIDADTGTITAKPPSNQTVGSYNNIQVLVRSTASSTSTVTSNYFTWRVTF